MSKCPYSTCGQIPNPARREACADQGFGGSWQARIGGCRGITDSARNKSCATGICQFIQDPKEKLACESEGVSQIAHQLNQFRSQLNSIRRNALRFCGQITDPPSREACNKEFAIPSN